MNLSHMYMRRLTARGFEAHYAQVSSEPLPIVSVQPFEAELHVTVRFVCPHRAAETEACFFRVRPTMTCVGYLWGIPCCTVYVHQGLRVTHVPLSSLAKILPATDVAHFMYRLIAIMVRCILDPTALPGPLKNFKRKVPALTPSSIRFREA